MTRFIILLFLGIAIVSCENEPLDTAIINKDYVDEELLDLIYRVPSNDPAQSIECIRFNYPFAIYVFESDDSLSYVIGIDNNEELIDLIDSLQDGQRMSINYPIKGTLNNGQLVEVNNNEELKAAIINCVNEERRGRCNNTLIDCPWEVIAVSDNQRFEGAIFNVNYNSSISFHVDQEAYTGSWLTITIGNELFMNIDLNDGQEITDFWDGNWLVHLISNDEIIISRENIVVVIQKNCDLECPTESYTSCEFEPGIANFELNRILPCIGQPSQHDSISAVGYSFHLSEQDALDGIDPISGEEFNNTENPQNIYIRTYYLYTDDLLDIEEITIEAVSCQGG